jgi:hypothetical protein
LDRDQIGAALEIRGSINTNELDEKLSLMEHIGVCFKLVTKREAIPLFLFPSLSTVSDRIGFSIPSSAQEFHHSGVRLTAPHNHTFTPGFFCSVTVTILSLLHITRREVIEVHNNGFVVSCQGLFLGQLLVRLERHSKDIVLLMLASQPDNLSYGISSIRHLVSSQFPQYTGFAQNMLCPTCVTGSIYNTENVGTYEKQSQKCFPHFLHEISKSKLSNSYVIAQKCKHHQQDHHHFFLNYRVATEGKKVEYLPTVEGKKGVSGTYIQQIGTSKTECRRYFHFLGPEVPQYGAKLGGWIHSCNHFLLCGHLAHFQQRNRWDLQKCAKQSRQRVVRI